MMKYIYNKKFVTYATIFIYSLPFIASAQGNLNFQLQNPLNANIGTSLPCLIASILNNIIEPLAAVLVVLMIIYSGFKFLTAQGNPKAIADARTGLLYVLIGAGILLTAAAISAAVSGTFNQLLSSSSSATQTTCP